MNLESTKLNNYLIKGYSTDYVFNTIKDNHNFYEIELLKKWTPKIRNTRVIFDVGANLGNHTLYWAENLRYNHIYCFEPYKPNFKVLKENIKGNNLKCIELVNKGLGNVQGYAEVVFTDEDNMGATTLEYRDNNKEDLIEIITIDTFVEQQAISELDFIKIDVEGFETNVLQGAKQTLTKFLPDIWVEVTLSSYKEVMRQLSCLNYVPVDIEGFNMLFLNRSKHTDLIKYDNDKVLESMFQYLEKTNNYYNNYIQSKKWIKVKDEKIVQLQNLNNDYTIKIKNLEDKQINLQESLQQASFKYREETEKYNKIKQSYQRIVDKYSQLEKEKEQIVIAMQQEKKEAVTSIEKEKEQILAAIQQEKKEAVTSIEKEKKEIITLVQDVYGQVDDIIGVLKANRATINKLETQNNYLKCENDEYRRKLALVTETFVGKIGIKGYKFLKKIKRKFK